MSSFIAAIPALLRHEGGHSNDPADRGGETWWGLSKRWLDTVKLAPPDSLEAAEAIYRDFWWRPHGYSAIDSQPIANKVFDMAVNMGARRAHSLAQQALGDAGHAVQVDGVLGPETLLALNIVVAPTWMDAVCQRQTNFYRHLVDADPKQARFLVGWLKRAEWRGE